jgi:flagella basal body P-ring formation protein FlgA
MMKRMALFLMLACSLLWAAQATVEFKTTAEISAGRIHLGDVADISGESSLREKLRVLEVGRLELPGRETRLSINAIKSFYIRSVCPPESLGFEGEGTIIVRSRAKFVSRDSLTQLLIAQLGPRMDGVMGRDWVLEGDNLPLEVAVPEGDYTWNLDVPLRFDGKGQETVCLRVDVKGETRMRYTLGFNIRRWMDVVRTVAPVQRGQFITNANVKMGRIEVTHQPRLLVSRLEDAVGRAALRTISRDLDVAESWLEKPYQVKEGDQVRMNVQIGEATVSTAGVARQNGYSGQRIEVVNAKTGKRLQAEVNGPGEVRILN